MTTAELELTATSAATFSSSTMKALVYHGAGLIGELALLGEMKAGGFKCEPRNPRFQTFMTNRGGAC